MNTVGCITRPHRLQGVAHAERQLMTAAIIGKGWSIAMKKIIGIAIVATALASPAFAQSFDPDNGTGNIVAGNTVAAPAPAGTTIVTRHLGKAAYAMSAATKSIPPRKAGDTVTIRPTAAAPAIIKCWATGNRCQE